jgi:hypothetical protein
MVFICGRRARSDAPYLGPEAEGAVFGVVFDDGGDGAGHAAGGFGAISHAGGGEWAAGADCQARGALLLANEDFGAGRQEGKDSLAVQADGMGVGAVGAAGEGAVLAEQLNPVGVVEVEEAVLMGVGGGFYGSVWRGFDPGARPNTPLEIHPSASPSAGSR